MSAVPLGIGWQSWIGSMLCTRPEWRKPYDFYKVEIWREEWEEPEVVRPDELAPWVNVYGLWWRPLPKPKLEPELRRHRR